MATPLFPFGQPLRKVEQADRTPKKAFVLGVYASAVHARWIGADGKQKVTALAVASEPYIFWRGENAEDIIKSIPISEGLGKLESPKNASFNGPSGRALDNLFLEPLGLTRENTWLCDLLPESRVNEKQRQALEKHYTKDIINKYGLSEATIKDFDKKELNSEERRKEILSELEKSKADKLILLGDLPIKWFLDFYAEKKHINLANFGGDHDTYGHGKELKINGKTYEVISLCHPRQASRLGSSNLKWGKLHDNWIAKRQNQFLIKH